MLHYHLLKVNVIKPFFHKSLLTYCYQKFPHVKLKYFENQRKSFTTLLNSKLLKESSDTAEDISKDPKLQELIKEMYKDFNITEELEDDSTKIKEDSVEPENQMDFSNKDIAYDPEIIYDYDEERLLRREGLWPDVVKKQKPKDDTVYERGTTGVFDVEELVELLRKEKAKDIVVVQIPVELQYADYLVFSSGKSLKHITVLSEYVRKLYKKKKGKSDTFVTIEGKGSKWVSIDMGNIILHIMQEETRMEKNLETLWALGSEYDDESQRSLES